MREMNFEELSDKTLYEHRSKLPLWGKLLIIVGALLLLILICMTVRYIDSAWGPWYYRVW